MNCIFLDNFRGFEKTIVPLKDVNFLVGENSTGKTSVLALISLLTKASFWMSGTPEFDSPEVKLGNFRDIVSANAKDKSYFRIGFFGEGKPPSGYLITFKEKEGMPFVSRYTFMAEGKQVQVKLRSKILYKYEDPYRVSGDMPKDMENMFMTWITEHDKSSGKYRTLRGPVSLLRTSLGALNAALVGEPSSVGKKLPRSGSRTLTFGWTSPFKETVMLAPIRTRPKRTYDEYNRKFSPEGEHIPYLIKSYFKKIKDKGKFMRFIRKFGKDSGLFQTINIKNFGRTVASPFELDIALENTLFKIVNVGYGVSQILPVIVEMFEEEEHTCFLVQQPEIHLHPRAQFALGNLIYEFATSEKKYFIVETHSDFIIDSFRLKCRKKRGKKGPEGQILYFERFEGGNRLFPIEILEDGKLPEEQPKGYRDFFIREQMRMLGY
jgi:hypothetical protein